MESEGRTWGCSGGEKSLREGVSHGVLVSDLLLNSCLLLDKAVTSLGFHFSLCYVGVMASEISESIRWNKTGGNVLKNRTGVILIAEMPHPRGGQGQIAQLLGAGVGSLWRVCMPLGAEPCRCEGSTPSVRRMAPGIMCGTPESFLSSTDRVRTDWPNLRLL